MREPNFCMNDYKLESTAQPLPVAILDTCLKVPQYCTCFSPASPPAAVFPALMRMPAYSASQQSAFAALFSSESLCVEDAIIQPSQALPHGELKGCVLIGH